LKRFAVETAATRRVGPVETKAELFVEICWQIRSFKQISTGASEARSPFQQSI